MLMLSLAFASVKLAERVAGGRVNRTNMTKPFGDRPH
jgi:hypothetical protein